MTESEQAFWQAIEAAPGQATPRLIFADWCDENGRVDLADVQRWLAATGRRPAKDRSEWLWYSEHHSEPIDFCFTLPSPLFETLCGTAISGGYNDLITYLVFKNRPEAEEALIASWVALIDSKRGRKAWKPDYEHVQGDIFAPQHAMSILYRAMESAQLEERAEVVRSTEQTDYSRIVLVVMILVVIAVLLIR